MMIRSTLLAAAAARRFPVPADRRFKRRGTVAGLVLATTLLASAAGCSATVEDDVGSDPSAARVGSATRISASEKSEAYELLPAFSRVHEIANPDGLTLRAYELYFDGAINGAEVWLGAFDASGAGYVFELAGRPMRAITKVEHVAPHGVRIVATRDDTIDDELKQGLPYELTIGYTLENGAVPWQIEANDSSGQSYQWLATMKPGAAMLGGILGATSATQDGVTAKAFETLGAEPPVSGRLPSLSIGGDPAMNGRHVLLMLDTGLHAGRFERETYDLGLDVSHVERLELVASDLLQIEGTEDFMNGQGEIESRRFAYSVRFTIDAGGAPSKTIELTRLAR